MTTYVICDNCGKKFKSQYQIENLKTNIVEGNIEFCPFCNQKNVTEKRNIVNE